MQKLRSQGVDFIIYAIHDGYDQTYSGTGAMAELAKATAVYGYHAKAYFG